VNERCGVFAHLRLLQGEPLGQISVGGASRVRPLALRFVARREDGALRTVLNYRI